MKNYERPILGLIDLYAYDILDSEEEKEFNDLVDLASVICDCPISMISFVDHNRQWFKAKKNMPHAETPIDEYSFCAQSILHDQIFEVEDALLDENFSTYKNVTDDIKIRFYAGSPIRSSNGNNLGTICVIDTKPKKLNQTQIEALQKLSRQASKLLELRLLNKKLSSKSKGLLKSSESYRVFFDNAPVPLWIYNIQCDKILAVNSAVEELYGYSREELKTLSLYNIISHTKSDLDLFYKRLKKESKINIVTNHIKKDGKSIVVDVTLTNIHYNGYDVIMATVIDLSEKFSLQQKLTEEKKQTKKKIEKATIYAQSQEREYLGRELHDNINQMLASIKLYLDIAYSDNNMRLNFIEQSKKHLQNTINEVRNLSHRLVKANTKGLNLVESIEEFIEPYIISKVFQINLDINCNLHSLAADVKINILRILQESVQNIDKYAQASKVLIKIGSEINHLELTVKDNGVGFDIKTINPGIGFSNISERTKKLKGVVNIKSLLGKGTTIKVKIPVVKERA